MKKIVALVSLASLGCLLALSPAAAKTHKHHKHHAQSSSDHRITESDRIRTAQWDLNMLGYRAGTVDGATGRQTTAAIRAFQIDYHLHASGTLTPVTYGRIVQEAMQALEHGRGPQTRSGPGAAMNEEPVSAAAAGSARFGAVEATREGSGSYSVAVNGRPVWRAANQPSAPDVSPVYDLGNAGAMLITSYKGDPMCPWKHTLVVVGGAGTTQDIPNCVRAFDAHTAQGSLFVAFPSGTGQPLADTWRYENGRLERL